MYLLVNNKKIFLKDAKGFFNKLIGLCFKKKINYAIRFRCNGIHTFFMFSRIDVILTDKNNNVLYIYNNLKKNKIILPKKNVYYTYELPCGFLNNIKIKKIEIIN